MANKLAKKLICLGNIKELLIDSLGLETDAEITEKTRFADLGAEPIDMLDIYFRSSTAFVPYTNGEKISKKGRELLLDTANLYKGTPNFEHLSDLANSTTARDFTNHVTVGDLVKIHNCAVIEDSKRNTPIKDLLNSPLQLFQVLRDMGVPLENYIGTLRPTSSNNIIGQSLSEKGLERVMEIGEYVGNRERAQILAEAGGGQKGSLASLYSHLTVEDLLNACSYESLQKCAA